MDPLPTTGSDEKRRDRKALVALAVVALIAVALVVYLVNRGDGGSPAAGSSTTNETAAGQTTAQSTAGQTTSDTAAETEPEQTTGDEPTTATTTSAAEPTEPSPTDPPADVSPGQALSDYYGLLPNNLETAYGRLTDRFKAARAPSFAEYQSWWGQMSAVTVGNVQAVGPEQVSATVSYTYKSGGNATEQHVYTMVKVNGQWAIDAQQYA